MASSSSNPTQPSSSGPPPSSIPTGRLTPSVFGSSSIPTSGRTTPTSRHSSLLPAPRAATPSILSSRNTPGSASVALRSSSGSYSARRDSVGLASPLYQQHQPQYHQQQSSPALNAPMPFNPGSSSSSSLVPQPTSRTNLALTSQPASILHHNTNSSNESSSLNSSQNLPTTVQVVLRIRPGASDSNVPARFQRVVINALNPTTVAIDTSSTLNPAASSTTPTANQSNKPAQRYTFDRVFSSDEGQCSIWSSVESLVSRFLEGYNVTVLAYGQTSSGKSYTMGTDRVASSDLFDSDLEDEADGPMSSDRIGVIPRAVHNIFHRIQSVSTTSNQISIKASYVEIYNEDLIDLIASSASASMPGQLPQVTIREDKDGKIIWSGLKEVKVSNARAVMDLLERGSSVRQTNSTDMNAQSSRSHAIFSLSLTQKKLSGTSGNSPTAGKRSRVTSPTPGSRSGTPVPPSDSDWVTVTSKFHFVDLAGSERLKRTSAAGERVKEGISINSGLHALGNVISALGDPSKAKTTTHIPYRDSKLTRLLQDSLGGNAYTIMIACVSPSEYNLNETLNTIKYANRARNIKNRAEVNAIEAGWEDIEYLQSTVLKLRKELSILKTGGFLPDVTRSLTAIDEEGDDRAPRFLELQGHLSELQAKYAKAVADLAQAQNNLDLADGTGRFGQKVSQSDFEGMIQPVVEEYEKSITALESQLALLKAALVHSEQSMKEQDEKLMNEQAINENQSTLIAELRARVGRLVEREAANEIYIKDLEQKLKIISDSDETSSGLLVDLKKELTKYKESEAHSEKYIKDLELKLLRHQESNVDLKARLDEYETQLQRREELFEALQNRYDALMAGSSEQGMSLLDQQKALLDELEARQSKLTSLEAALKMFQDEKEAIERQKKEDLDSVLIPIQSSPLPDSSVASTTLAPAATASADSTKTSGGPNDRRAHRSISPGSFTPPATPAAIPAVASSSHHPTPLVSQSPEGNLAQRFQGLQEQYESTLIELEQVQTKYNNSLKELEDLSAQLDESRLMQPTPTYRLRRLTTTSNAGSLQSHISPLPSPLPSSPSTSQQRFPNNNALPVKGFGTPLDRRRSHPESGREDGDAEDSLETLETTQAETNYEYRSDTPVRHSVSGSVVNGQVPRTRRSVQIGSGSRLSRQNSITNSVNGSHSHQPPSFSHHRSLSLSLSQDLSQGVVNLNRGGLGSLLLSTSPNSRSVSPQTGRVAEFQTPERSYESLEKEVIQLQEVLKEREEEIRTLEHSIRDIQRLSDSVPASSRLSAPVTEDDTHATSPSASSPIEDLLPVDTTALSSGARNSLEQIKQNFYGTVGSSDDGRRESELTESGDSSFGHQKTKSIRRLDDLMRSMAQKESAHIELIESLKEELRTSQKQHVELVKLSRDQVANMSSEIEGLRGRLGAQDTVTIQLDEMESVLMAKEAELEAVKGELQRTLQQTENQLKELKDGEQGEIERLTAEHKDVLQRLVAESEERVRAKEGELERLEASWQARLNEELAQRDSTRAAALEAERVSAVESLEAVHALAVQKLQQRFEAETAGLAAMHQEEMATQQTRSKDTAARVEAAHAERLRILEGEHVAQMAILEMKLAQSISQNPAQVKALEQEVESRLRLQMEEMKTTHARELVSERERVEEEKAQVMEDIEKAHAQMVEDLRGEHEEILVASLTELDARRTRKFEASVAALQIEHEEDLKSLKEEQRRQLETIVSQQEEQSGGSAGSSSRLIEEIQARYKAELETAKRDHEVLLQRQREEDENRFESIKAEVKRLQQVGAHGSEAEAELQEALDALSTLDKALHESQAERERLMKELKQSTGLKEKLENEMKLEREQWAEERERLVLKGREDAPAPPPSSAAPADRTLLRCDSPSLMSTIQRTHLLNAASNKPPPPTPPPSMPPPPPPQTSLPGLPTTMVGGTRQAAQPALQQRERTSNTSSGLSRANSHSGRESPSTSVGTNSLVESVSMDPRVLKKIEEQETSIMKLAKQLSHCEVDLKANLDLVTNLESALNDTERNLRKSRLQMNELAKERDKLMGLNESLRSELFVANRDLDRAKTNVKAEKEEFENRLGEERRAKESAKKMLETRMEEMQNSRMNRKSKFNCF